MQSPLRLLFPAQCLSCGEPLASEFGLCGTCWGKTPFIAGPVCEKCGTPLIGEAHEGDLCDACLETERPWSKGRAALLYRDNARRMVLALKEYGRLDLARPAALWMQRAATGALPERDAVVVPVPSHWTRLIRRRFNPAALLASEFARASGLECAPGALIRSRWTKNQEGMSRASRFENQAGSVRPHPRRGAVLEGRQVILVDDVMTTGATMATCTKASFEAGARDVFALVLARVARGD